MRGNKDTQSPALCGVHAPGTPLHPVCAERGDRFPVHPAGSQPAPGTHPWAPPKSSPSKAAPRMHLPPPASCCLSDLSRRGPAFQASNSACLFSQHTHYRQGQETHFKGEKLASTSPSPEFSGGWMASLSCGARSGFKPQALQRLSHVPLAWATPMIARNFASPPCKKK